MVCAPVLITTLCFSRELLVMGGDSAKDQMRALQEGVDIVCGTPGRLDDLISTGKLDLSGVRWRDVVRLVHHVDILPTRFNSLYLMKR